MLRTIFLLLVATLVAGDFMPTAPGPTDSCTVGYPCTMKWIPGDAGNVNWKNITIMLMSGSNYDMKPVTIVASGLDGSDPSLSPLNWTCPDVSPYSVIYFFQFTNGNDVQSSKWTTRFLITSPSGPVIAPEHASQPNGDPIPWGTGTLSASSSNSSSTATSSSDSSTTKIDTNEDTSSDSPNKISGTGAPGRQATQMLALPQDSGASVQSGGAALAYSSGGFNSGARSLGKRSSWSPSLSVVLVVSAISWLV